MATISRRSAASSRQPAAGVNPTDCWPGRRFAGPCRGLTLSCLGGSPLACLGGSPLAAYFSFDRHRKSYLNKISQLSEGGLTSPGPYCPRPRTARSSDRADAASCQEVLTVTAVDPLALDLPQLFTPAQAAEILRSLGLKEMTECALRTRAYRRQVPFHLNGRRIRFTASDLREILEGQPRRPTPADTSQAPPPGSRPASRRSSTRRTERPPQAWRARSARDTSSSVNGKQR